jgi:hypothetical protein
LPVLSDFVDEVRHVAAALQAGGASSMIALLLSDGKVGLPWWASRVQDVDGRTVWFR